MSKAMKTEVITSNTTIAGNGSPVFNYYGPFLIEKGDSFAVHMEAGAGTDVTIDVNYTICATKSGTYFTPSEASLIFTALAVTAIPNAVGFTPVAARWLKIGIKNKHATTSLTGLYAKLIIQEDFN